MSFGIGTRTAIDVGLGGIIAFATNPWGGSAFARASAAYSVRIPANSIYNGPLLRVRRSSDNAEQDIGTAGAQVAKNRNFATASNWTLGANVSITGNAISCSGTVLTIAGQNMGLVTGRVYNVVFTVNKTGSAGPATIRVSTGTSTTTEGGGTVVFPLNPPNGLHVWRTQITATGPCFVFASSEAFFNGTISFISVQEASRLDGQDAWLDEYALAGFVGIGSGFVTTWYDQSGNGRNATQTSATEQPRIVNAGVIDLLNNKPALYPGAAGTSATFVLPAISAPAFSAVINTSGAVPSLGGLFGCVIDNGARRAITQGLGWRAVSSATSDYAAATDWQVNGSTAVTTIDGVPGVSNLTGIDTVLSVQNGTTAALARLFASYVTPGRFYVGWCGEVIFFSSNFTAATSRQTLERNQGTAFGITVA